MGPRVAIIGGGAFGLMALKNLKDEGFSVTLYESRAWVGGIWKPSDDASLSTLESTRFNSSKYRSAISDFPMPADMDDFPTATQLQKYFESYCNHFELWSYIQLNTGVEEIKRTDDLWTVSLKHQDSSEQSELFDKVIVACGTFVEPRQPTFQGVASFPGHALHVKDYRRPDDFAGQKVLVIGTHASAQDAVESLSSHASKVYISHRGGLLLVPNYVEDGSTYDRGPPLGVFAITLYIAALWPSLFHRIADNFLQALSKKAFPDIKKSWGFDPPPSIATAPPLVASVLYPHLASGFAEPVSEVAKIGGSSIILKSGRILTDIGFILYCTGYHSIIPVRLSPPELDPYPVVGEPPRLYRNHFPMHEDPKIRNSLAFLGQGAAPLPGFASHEGWSLCVSQIWLGNSSLPPLHEMQRWYHKNLAWREGLVKQYKASSIFYAAFLPAPDTLAYVDECAGLGIRTHFGLLGRWTNWRAWHFWWTDRELYSLCLRGIISPAIFRLFDMGKRKPWSGARAQIFADNAIVEEAARRRSKEGKT